MGRSTSSFTDNEYDDVNDRFYDIENFTDNILDTLDDNTQGGSLEDDFEDYEDQIDALIESAEEKLIALAPSGYSQIDNIVAQLSDLRDDLVNEASDADEVNTDEELDDYFENVIDIISDGTRQASKVTTVLDDDDYQDMQDEIRLFLDALANTLDALLSHCQSKSLRHHSLWSNSHC